MHKFIDFQVHKFKSESHWTAIKYISNVSVPVKKQPEWTRKTFLFTQSTEKFIHFAPNRSFLGLKFRQCISYKTNIASFQLWSCLHFFRWKNKFPKLCNFSKSGSLTEMFSFEDFFMFLVILKSIQLETKKIFESFWISTKFSYFQNLFKLFGKKLQYWLNILQMMSDK